MKMMSPELAAEIAGCDAHDALGRAQRADCLNARAHCTSHVSFSEPVDYDLHRGADVRRQARALKPFQGRTVAIVGGGNQSLILGTDLRTGAHATARKRHDAV